jgi:ABC-type spermidine/putrescine transport system permease subunit I
VAYVMARATGARLQLMAAFIIVPLWTSVVIRSYAWMVVFQRRGVLNDGLLALGLVDEPVRFIPGALAVHVGMVHIMLPFMILPLIANMRAIDRSLLRAAEVLGAGPVQSFLRVFLPLSLPGVTAGCALVFMMSLGFYVTPALLGGPRHMMAAVLIEQQANGLLNWGLASALATILLAVTTAIYIGYARLTGGGAASAR